MTLPKPLVSNTTLSKRPTQEIDWQWRAGTATTPPSGSSRKTATVHFTVGLIFTGLFLYHDKTLLAAVVGIFASSTFLVALLSPTNLYARLQARLNQLGLFVGTTLSWLTLLPIFFLFFVPFRFLFRRHSNDSLKRRYQPELKTYWKTSPPVDDPGTTNQRLF